MKHARLKAARAFRCVIAAGLLAAAGPACAQPALSARSDLPGQGSLDAEIDPFPFDPRLEIRSYLENRLPRLWWANEPEYNLGVFSVTVHVPEGWRGNPTSALLQLCPEPRHTLWRHIKRIELQAFYRLAMWPGVTCRP